MCINNTQEHARERRVKVFRRAEKKERGRPREEKALLLHVFQALMEGLANETNDSEL